MDPERFRSHAVQLRQLGARDTRSWPSFVYPAPSSARVAGARIFAEHVKRGGHNAKIQRPSDNGMDPPAVAVRKPTDYQDIAGFARNTDVTTDLRGGSQSW